MHSGPKEIPDFDRSRPSHRPVLGQNYPKQMSPLHQRILSELTECHSLTSSCWASGMEPPPEQGSYATLLSVCTSKALSVTMTHNSHIQSDYRVGGCTFHTRRRTLGSHSGFESSL